jgi:hypothetical protein
MDGRPPRLIITDNFARGESVTRSFINNTQKVQEEKPKRKSTLLPLGGPQDAVFDASESSNFDLKIGY